MTIWLISDTHFGHENIIRYCGRPFANATEMDERMIANWNLAVKPEDHVYHLGDVAMRVQHLRQLTGRLNGHKRLLRGNHDIFKTREYLKFGFEEIGAYRVISDVVLSHIPIHELSLKQRWLGNIHGHIHERPSFGPRYLNVSVEQTSYAPIALEDAIARLKAQLPADVVRNARGRHVDEDFSSDSTEAAYAEWLAAEEGFEPS